MNQIHTLPTVPAEQAWLKKYYYVRGAFSAAWVILALTAGAHSALFAAALLVAYPAWDAFANLVDARRSGGLARNRTQAYNAIASLAVAFGVMIALPDMHHVLAVIGAWAMLAGLLQLATGLRRWKLYGAQWAMMLSGAQSTLAGGAFIFQSTAAATATIATLAGYAGFGALYFLIAAISLSVAGARRQRA